MERRAEARRVVALLEGVGIVLAGEIFRDVTLGEIGLDALDATLGGRAVPATAAGMEFEHTALLLPPEPNAVLTRELLYTGVTRARRRFSLVGSAAVVEETIARRTQRHSGLAARLQAG